MRLIVVLSVICRAACASEKLAQAPPPGVDLCGAWQLNEADSDDAQRLIAAQFNAPAANQSNSPDAGGGGGRGGRGRSGAGGMPLGAPMGPVMPPVSELNEA